VTVDLRGLPAEEAAVRRFVRRLWLPYHRELEVTTEDHELDDEVDIVEEEVPFRLDRLDTEGYRLWVAVDDGGEPGDDSDDEGTDSTDCEGSADSTDSEASTDTDVDPLASTGGHLVGFVATEVDRSPSVFDRPDRLVIGDLFVREGYRGTGLARDLVGRATERAREADCDELALDVHVDNDRAIAFYEKLGFEPRRHRMRVPVEVGNL